jgi:hypothetical protein
MSKFIKRISKFKKHPRFSVYIGNHSEWLDELIEFFPTVFWIFYDAQEIKSKRLIYIENINLLLTLQEIDMVFVDSTQKDRLLSLQSLFLKCQPIIFLKCDLPISKEQTKFFKQFGYQATDCHKDYKIWKFQ